MAQRLGNVAVGSIVKLKERGVPQKYLVVHQGRPSAMYDVSCDGTWLLRKDAWTEYNWDNDGGNEYLKSNFSKLAIGIPSTNQQIHTDRPPLNCRDLLQKTA